MGLVCWFFLNFLLSSTGFTFFRNFDSGYISQQGRIGAGGNSVWPGSESVVGLFRRANSLDCLEAPRPKCDPWTSGPRSFWAHECHLTAESVVPQGLWDDLWICLLFMAGPALKC